MPEKETHRKRIDNWAKIGKELGFKVYKEYPISDGNIDCVWENEEQKIFIEIELNNYQKQVFKNLFKGLYLKPSLIIFDCKNGATANKVRGLIKRNNINARVINRQRIFLDYIKQNIFSNKRIVKIGYLYAVIRNLEVIRQNIGKRIKIDEFNNIDGNLYHDLAKQGFLEIKGKRKYVKVSKQIPEYFYYLSKKNQKYLVDELINYRPFIPELTGD